MGARPCWRPLARYVAQFRDYFAKQVKPDGTLSHLQRCILSAKGWRRLRSPRDGHCQFHSVGFAVSESHELVRAHAVRWIRANPTECLSFLTSEDAHNADLSDLEQYVQGMADGAWGDNLTLYALSHHYKRAVCVLTDHMEKPWCRINPDFGDPIHVAFYAEVHYDAIDCDVGP